MKLKNDQIDIICEYFERQPVKQVFVFGSYARNEATEESDIDLLIELDYDQMKGGLQFITMKLELQELLNRKISLVSTNGISKHLQPFIEKDKVPIYSRVK